MGESERLYTLDQARVELARRQCRAEGHDWDIIEQEEVGPVGILCSRCGDAHSIKREKKTLPIGARVSVLVGEWIGQSGTILAPGPSRGYLVRLDSGVRLDLKPEEMESITTRPALDYEHDWAGEARNDPEDGNTYVLRAVTSQSGSFEGRPGYSFFVVINDIMGGHTRNLPIRTWLSWEKS